LSETALLGLADLYWFAFRWFTRRLAERPIPSSADTPPGRAIDPLVKPSDSPLDIQTPYGQGMFRPGF
jgi:hypothetical protein